MNIRKKLIAAAAGIAMVAGVSTVSSTPASANPAVVAVPVWVIAVGTFALGAAIVGNIKKANAKARGCDVIHDRDANGNPRVIYVCN